MQPIRRIAIRTFAAVALTLALPVSAQTTMPMASEAWTWRLGLNGFLPSIRSSTQFDVPAGGSISAETDPGNYLSKLKFTFMGTLEGRHGAWSFLADALYLNLGDLKSSIRAISGPTGIVTVPIDSQVSSGIKGFIGTIEGGYAVLQTPGAHMDLLAGVRYAGLTAKVDWELSGPAGGFARTGGVEATKHVVDGVVGVRGDARLGGNWDVRYYLDAGAGGSQLTWQASAGVGYRFSWGDAVLRYRHLAYQLRNDRPISDISFSGPQIEVGFTF